VLGGVRLFCGLEMFLLQECAVGVAVSAVFQDPRVGIVKL